MELKDLHYLNESLCELPISLILIFERSWLMLPLIELIINDQQCRLIISRKAHPTEEIGKLILGLGLLVNHGIQEDGRSYV